MKKLLTSAFVLTCLISYSQQTEQSTATNKEKSAAQEEKPSGEVKVLKLNPQPVDSKKFTVRDGNKRKETKLEGEGQ